MEMDSQPVACGTRPGMIAGGAILLVVGATLWLDTSGMLDVPVRRLIGPSVLIMLGALMTFGKAAFIWEYRGRPSNPQGVASPRARGRHAGGVWLIGIGVWLLIVQTHALGFDQHNSWPLFIILSGLIMLIRGIR